MKIRFSKQNQLIFSKSLFYYHSFKVKNIQDRQSARSRWCLLLLIVRDYSIVIGGLRGVAIKLPDYCYKTSYFKFVHI